MSFHKAVDLERSCQYIGEDIGYEYYISNEGNFASWDGATHEAFFQPVSYRGFDAYVEEEAPDSGEIFTWFSLENYIHMKDGQALLSLESMMKLVADHPLIDFMYVYDLAAGATDFFADNGGLNFTDAKDNRVRLNLKSDKYDFYVDGLYVRFAPKDKVIMYMPTSENKTEILED
jgi:hypothetical protein